MIDIRQAEEALNAINEILRKGSVFEGKIEHGKIAIVEIKRTLKTKSECCLQR